MSGAWKHGYVAELPEDISVVVINDTVYQRDLDGNFTDGTDYYSPTTVAALLKSEREKETE